MACLSSVTSIFFHVLIDFHARPLRSTPRAHTVDIPVTRVRAIGGWKDLYAARVRYTGGRRFLRLALRVLRT